MKKVVKKHETEYEKISRMIDRVYRLDRHSYNFTTDSMWCTDRITWAWKFKKITELQKDELVDRMIEIFDTNY